MDTNIIPEMKDIVSIDRGDHTMVTSIEWYMCSWCNYNCFYCNPTNHTQSKLEDTSYYIKQAKKIAKKMSLDGYYVMLLKGGEVTYLDLEKILDVFTDFNMTYHLTTNLSNKLDYYLDLIDFCRCRNQGIKIEASYHGRDTDNFISKLVEISKVVPITASFVIDDSTYDEYSKVIKRIEKLNNPYIHLYTKPMKIGDFNLSKNNSKYNQYNKLHSVFINNKSYEFGMLDVPVFIKDFDPYGFECTCKYDILFVINHFVKHRCGNKQTIICKKHNCDLCMVESIYRVEK